MNRFKNFALLCALVLLSVATATTQLNAQQPLPPATPAGAGNDVAQLKQRIAELEQKIADLQVLYGTVESFLGQSGGLGGAPAGGFAGGAPIGGASGDVNGRLDSLETQIRALSGQIRQLGGNTGNAFGADRRGSYQAPPATLTPPQPTQYGRATPPADLGGFSAQVTRNDSQDFAVQPLAPPPPGASSLSPPGVDGGNLSNSPLPPLGSPNTGNFGTRVAAAPSGPKALYENAYGKLLKRDYSGAETKFAEFLKKHPKDSLAGNAQFWLAESQYVRGEYRKAAQNFLKGYKTYKGAKAPDSLLKLAMSLSQLGQKDAACTTFRELDAKFPNAPNHVRQRAQAERRQAGC